MSDLMTEREMSERLKIAPVTARLWRRAGRGPAWIRIERGVRYRVVDVEAYLSANRTEGAS